MPKPFRLLFALAVLAALTVPAAASAWHAAFPRTENIVPLGEHARPGGFPPAPSPATANSDIAFWRNYVIQGHYLGFRILDVSNPMAPALVSDTTCGDQQGDVTISPDGNVLVRSQDAPRIIPNNDPANACAFGTSAPQGQSTLRRGWEGLQIFDVSNKAAPRFVKGVFTDFGSHTHTQYHDKANNRLIIYVSRAGAREGQTGLNVYSPTEPSPYGGQNWPATNGCITAVAVPLDNPAGAQVVNRCIPAGREPVTVSAGGCHDVAVFEGKNRMFGACRPYHTLWDITDPVNPVLLSEMTLPLAVTPHSASFSWNGEILLAGWEPGGGGQARCQANDPPYNKSIAFFNTSGTLIGTWTLPRPQGSTENCTIHNYNVVPFLDRHVLVQGSYQSGWSFVDFTAPSAARELGFADPPPLSPTQLILGGDWSTYWYNDLVYTSDITRGLAIWDVTEPWWDRALQLPYLNPQTQEREMECTVTAASRLRATVRGTVTARVRVWEQGAPRIPVRLVGGGLNRTVQTNDAGVVRATVTARRQGTLRVVVPDTLNMEGCATSRRIAAAPRPPAPTPPLTGRNA